MERTRKISLMGNTFSTDLNEVRKQVKQVSREEHRKEARMAGTH